MEDCYNYNRIIEAIEENIHKEDREIYGLAASAAGLSRREAALIVKNVEGEDYNMYIKRRKIIRCAQHKVLNPTETWQKIAASFAIYEYSTFNRRFKAFLGVAPEDFLEWDKGDVMGMNPGYIGKNNVVVKTETLVQKETETVYVQSDPQIIVVHEVEDDLFGPNPMGELLKEEFGIGDSPVSSPDEVRQRLLNIVTSDSDTKGLLDAYNTIIELEEVRAVYGLTFEDVLYFYIKTNKDCAALYDECERICDERIEELYAEDFEEQDWDEWEREFYTNELNLTEAYAYYQGDDEIEPEDEDEFNNNSIKHMYY